MEKAEFGVSLDCNFESQRKTSTTKGSAKEEQLNVVPYRFKKYSTEINRNRKPRVLKNLLKSQSFQVDFASLQPLDTNFDSKSCTFMSKASLGADRHHQRPLQHKVDSKLWHNRYNPRRKEQSCEIARPRHTFKIVTAN